MIDVNLLLAWGASSRKYAKGTCIFMEGEMPRYYYQLEYGQVEMFNANADGKVFTQGVFHDGQSFGEPPLFINEPYPASALAVADTIVLRVPRETFFQLLQEYRGIEREFLRILSLRVYHKALVARSIVNCSPELRLKELLLFLRKYEFCGSGKTHIQLTRQQLANLCGLRVETVIRTLATMKKKGLVDIVNRKLYV